MLNLLPNFWLSLGFGARSSQVGVRQESQPCVVQNKNQLEATQSINKSIAESRAFARLSAEFRTFAGSDSNAKDLVIGLRDGTGITLTHCKIGNTSSASFTPPTGRMGYSNVSIALSLARQQLVGQGIRQPTPHQLLATLVGGTINKPLSGNSIKLHGILQLKAEGMGWAKIASLLGIKLGSVIGEARPVPAVLQPHTNSCASLVTRTVQIRKSMTQAATSQDTSQYASNKPGQVPEKNAKHLAI